MGSSLNQRTAEFSLCNTRVLLLDLAFKQPTRRSCREGTRFTGQICSVWRQLFVAACQNRFLFVNKVKVRANAQEIDHYGDHVPDDYRS